MLADRADIRRRLQAAQGLLRQGKPADRTVGQLIDLVERSARERAWRAANLPTPTFPSDLPVAQKKDEIAAAIASHQVVVVCGETGSGKTTQLPKICLALGRGVDGLIGHTQPRRIAARAVAGRVAEELSSPIGEAVGYKVRFGDQTSPRSFVKLMTDGVLLAETQGDRDLLRYDTIIIDEAHERSLNIDFLLGYIRQLLPRRPDLKVVITSATINPAQFSAHFGGAPVIEVSGRVYPVEVRYRPPEHLVGPDGEPDDEDQDIEHALVRAVAEIAREPGEIGTGDVLVFLPGEREIREAAEDLRKHHPPGTEILPLYARLSAAEQMRVFERHGRRRIVLSTNIAETSLTVPGIRSVIDVGLARVSRYSARTKVQRLPVEPISRASADQRKGRCGRVGPGLCIRLYGEDDFLKRPEFTEPEILRTNLASVILQMKSLRLGDAADFPFIDPPEPRMIADGFDTLVELGAIEPEDSPRAGELTPLGRELARLPIDPRVGRMILAATKEHALVEVLVIAAALSVQDPRERPIDKQNAADEAHARFKDPLSDFQSFLNLWRFFAEQEEKLSGGRLRKMCHQNFLSYVRMREWRDVHRQLRELMLDAGHRENERQADSARVHRALLTGLLANVGRKSENFEFSGCRGGKFAVFPGSGLFEKPPQWVMAAEIVQTTRRYARVCARVDPKWIEELAPHLLKHHYADPHWDAERAQAVALQTSTLYGLEIIKNRRVHYGPIDPARARQIFIHHALLEGEFLTEGEFFLHNHGLEKEIRALEVKTRRTDLLADYDTRFRFYDSRIPAEVINGETFEAWRKRAERREPRLLFMSHADLLIPTAEGVDPAMYPDRATVGGCDLPLRYAFETGAAHDGVTVDVPLEALPQLEAWRGGWLVPGLVRARVVALLRALPKSIRRTIDTPEQLADRILPELDPNAGPIEDQVRERLGRMVGEEIGRDVWNAAALPEHLRANYRVLDESGKPIASGRDLAAIRAEVGQRAAEAFQRLARSLYDREGVTDWDFGDLPRTHEIRRGAAVFVGFPALADGGKWAALRLLDTPEAARMCHRRGLLRLFWIRGESDLRHVGKALPGFDSMALHHAPLGPPASLRDQITERIAERMYLEDDADIRTRAEFEKRLEAGWGRISPARELVCEHVGRVLSAAHAVRVRLSGALPPAWRATADDAREHLASLVYPGFIGATPREWFEHYPRYLAGIASRLNKLQGAGLARDELQRGEFRPHWRRLIERASVHQRQNVLDPELVRYRWMLEEFRVQLFAQELRTAIPVSGKRLDEQWAKVRAG